MSLPRVLRCLISLLCLSCLFKAASFAQPPVVPTVSFTCDFPASNPSHYAFTLTSDGKASYISDGKLNLAGGSPTDDAAPGDGPFRMNFAVSAATATRVFDLVKSARYFQGTIDSKKKNVASTGDKTLIYHDADHSNMANYNYSTIPAVQELTALFQNLSAAIEFGRRLDYEYRYQKLALDDELKRMEETSTLQDVGSDLSAVAPALQKIADDPSVINTVRARAMRLLRHTAAPGK